MPKGLIRFALASSAAAGCYYGYSTPSQTKPQIEPPPSFEALKVHKPSIKMRDLELMPTVPKLVAPVKEVYAQSTLHNLNYYLIAHFVEAGRRRPRQNCNG